MLGAISFIPRQRRIFLRNASWPETIDGNPGTVFNGGRFIGTLEFHVVGADRPFPERKIELALDIGETTVSVHQPKSFIATR